MRRGRRGKIREAIMHLKDHSITKCGGKGNTKASKDKMRRDSERKAKQSTKRESNDVSEYFHFTRWETKKFKTIGETRE